MPEQEQQPDVPSIGTARPPPTTPSGSARPAKGPAPGVGGAPGSGSAWLIAGRLICLAGLVLVVIGVAGRYLQWPILTSTLGPTLYLFVAHPRSEISRARTAALGHGVAIAVSLALLATMGLWQHASIDQLGYTSVRQGVAAGLAVGLTLAILHALRSHHAPAAATAILIATGLARPGKPLFGLLVGLGAVILLGPPIGRLPFGRAAAASHEALSPTPRLQAPSAAVPDAGVSTPVQEDSSAVAAERPASAQDPGTTRSSSPPHPPAAPAGPVEPSTPETQDPPAPHQG